MQPLSLEWDFIIQINETREASVILSPSRSFQDHDPPIIAEDTIVGLSFSFVLQTFAASRVSPFGLAYWQPVKTIWPQLLGRSVLNDCLP